MGGNHLLSLIGIGTSLVVGTVGVDGEPRATRAWATRVLDAETGRIRVLMSADDSQALGNLASGVAALTGADVRTLQSVQVKGAIVAVEPATAEDLEQVALHTDAFFRAVEDTDGIPVSLLRRLMPHEVIAFELVVDGTFDQSPGPSAGSAVGPVP